ncbi:DUF1553 domain-containing protein [uncultured Paludibaculum sp.]|uniref:DUF1553 domain-containing protein n=1 Tax=uncultured Paludibaculum sp. TaxID=1765020 RepID=UPI002AAB13FF|nr:DUF1553 domain-containing protein [uncultured Paludibaculum sp.]
MNRTVCVIALLWAVAASAAAPPKPVDFQKEVRPILSDACFHCHGNDKTTRMAGLRLDTRDGAFSKRKNGTVIVPKNPQASLLIQRINNSNIDKRMPPVYSHKTLTEDQRATLARWIQQGADWKEHWAFSAPVKVAPPPVKNTEWVRNPIDQFILAKLESQGLAPAPEANRRTLIRRLALDLTGLPPKLEEVEAFVEDKDSNAYEKLVDRYLANPHWGEHRARYWLDAARYGDTHGIHIDNYREIWPYRDWVIQAFNSNMPFDRFTTEQLAGDLLPNPTLDQRIATGFQRCNVTTNEAGIIIDEYDAIYAKDRADTIGAVYMGLTVGCATCHDHKFDPIPSKDFYALGAFFRNTTQNIMDGNASDPPPIVVIPKQEDRPRWDAIQSREATLKEELVNRRKALEGDTGSGRPNARLVMDPNGAIQVETAEERLNLPFTEGLQLGGSPWPDRTALFFGPKSELNLPAVPLDVKQPFTLSAWFYYPKGESTYSIAAQLDTKQKDKTRGWMLFVGGRVVGMRFYGDDGKSMEVRGGHLDQVIPGTWNHLVMTYDGTGAALGVRFFLNKKEIGTQRDVNATIKGNFKVDVPIKLGNPKREDDGAIADFRILGYTLSQQEAALLNPGEPGSLALFNRLRGDEAYQTVSKELHDLDLERRVIRKRGAISLVMEERTDQKPFAHVLYRGMYDQPRAKVDANTPSVLPPMLSSMPHNRLGLAEWLMSQENPLTSRVTVNRFWQQLFGDGIVKTSDDFGSQGEGPVNQALLDWMAVEFRDGGWDVKKFFKLLVTSSTYRQAALTTPEKLEKDPDNRWLSRGPRYRMEGEMIRDYALAASGLLKPTIGGPSVKPYQPAGVWEAVAMEGSNTRNYKEDHGDKLYRRSLYTFWKRSAPPASMEIFNAPTRETCTVRRERTNTPLQALVTMNDEQFVEAARALATRAMESAKTDVDRQLMFVAENLLDRPLEDKEMAVVKVSYKNFLKYYDTQPADAKKLVHVGESKEDGALPTVELAALTMVTNQLMNLDEVLTK